MEKRNVTLSLPVHVLKKARHRAIEEDTSLSGLLAGYVERIVNEAAERSRATERIRWRLDRGLNLGTEGSIDWRREDLHER
jgi:hypothetical protein